MDDERDEFEISMEQDSMDAADFFLAAVQHDLPDYILNAEQYLVKGWRLTWIIKVSEQFDTKVLEDVAFKWQKEIFFERGWLVGYSIQREDESEQEQGDTEDH